jgi:hypothetical protein
MIEFMIANWDSVALFVVLVVALALMVQKGYTAQVKQILFYLVTEAEAQFGGGTGELKYSAVSTWLYDRLPLVAKLVFTNKSIDELIEQAVLEMKEYLEKNKKAQKLVLGVEEE